MKKFLPYILILVIVVGIFAPTSKISAQFEGIGAPAQNTTGTPSIIPSTDQNGTPLPGTSGADTGTNCSVWSLGTCIANGLTNIVTEIAYMLLRMVSLLLWLAGTLLDFVMRYTILEMRDHVTSLNGINIAWKLIRDLMNIAFIFMLVYEGILLIIGQVSNTNQIKKFVTGIVLASLLINFSLFFTKTMIDASNIVTVGFYNSILDNADTISVTDPSNTSSGANAGQTRQAISGLSVPFMKYLGISSFWSTKSFDAVRKDVGGNTNMIVIPIMGIILFLIVSFIFFAVSILFIIRYVVLVILLMLSPIAYMGLSLPFMNTYAKQWWSAFNSQILFAPIYMIMTWVILTLMGSSGFISNGDGWGAVLQPGASSTPNGPMSLVFNFVVIIGLIITSLVVAKSTSAQGHKLIGQATGKLSAFAGGAVMGGTARLSRNTIGRWGNATANDQDLADRVAKGTASRSERLKFAAANRAATSTFDARATNTFGSIANATGMKNDFGKVDAKKENYKAQREEADKSEAKAAEKYKPTDLAVDQAKAKLKKDTVEGRKFEEEEAARKAAHEKYINSEKYINEKKLNETKKQSLNRKDEEEIRIRESYIQNAKQKIEVARNRMSSATISEADKNQRRVEIEKFENEIGERERAIKEAKDNIANRDKAWKEMENKEKNFISDEKRAAIAVAGGTKYDKQNRKWVDEGGGEYAYDPKIDSAYKQRMEGLASQVENRGAISRYSSGILGSVTNAVGLTSTPLSNRERRELGRRLRANAKAKSGKDKAKEALEALAKEDETLAPSETPAAPAAETPPAAPGGDGGATT